MRIHQAKKCNFISIVLKLLKIKWVKILQFNLVIFLFEGKNLFAHITDEVIMVNSNPSFSLCCLHDHPDLVMVTIQHKVDLARLLHFSQYFPKHLLHHICNIGRKNFTCFHHHLESSVSWPQFSCQFWLQTSATPAAWPTPHCPGTRRWSSSSHSFAPN